MKQQLESFKSALQIIVAFVEKANGNILKPATYKVPAKHARGNINSPSCGMEAINNYGNVIYLK